MHFSDTYLPRRDGVITSLRTLVAAQRTAGHDPLTVVPRHPDQPAEDGMVRLRAVPCGVANLRVSPWLLRGAAATGTLDRIAAHGADLVHVHTPGPIGLLGVLAAQRLGLPLVQTYHTDLHAYVDAYRFPIGALRAGVRLYARRLDRPRPAMRDDPVGPAGTPRRLAMDACNRLLLGEADAVVVPTRAVLDRITLPVPAERTFLVPTGVAGRPVGASAVAAFKAEHGLLGSDRVILFVGRINREKGIDLLISAYARIAAAASNTRLVLVGAIYEARWLQGLLASLPPAVAARVVVLGEQPPDVVAAAYACADVFAFPSLTDTQALVLQEAALAGVPAVLVDPVLHRYGPLGPAGVLAEPSPAGFAATIRDLIENPDRARMAGLAAAAHASGHTPARYAAAMQEVYQYAAARAGRLNACGRTRR